MNAVTARDAALSLIVAWHDDPVLFARDVFAFQPDPWQEAFMRLVAANPRVLVRSCVGAGKSAVDVMLMAWWLVTRTPCKVILTSGKFQQILDVFWPEMEQWGKNMPDAFRQMIKFKRTKDYVTLEGFEDTNIILPRTAQAHLPDTLQGLHSPNIMVLMDEAFALPKAIGNTLEGAMTTPGSKMVGTGNHTRNFGYAAQCFQPGSGWKTLTISAIPHKEADFVSSLVDPEWVEYMRKHPEDSHQWRTRVMGLNPLEDANQFIASAIIRACLDREVEAVEGYREHWGLDVAGSGMSGDRTALAFRKGNVQSRPTTTWRGLTVPKIVDHVVETWNDGKEKPAYIFVDAIGVGAGVFDLLKERLDERQTTRVVGVNVTHVHEVIDRENYVNVNAELLGRMKDWLESPISKLIDPDTADEMTWYRVTYTENGGKLKQVSKHLRSNFDRDAIDDDDDDMPSRSPDAGDAFKLTFFRRDVRDDPHTTPGWVALDEKEPLGWMAH